MDNICEIYSCLKMVHNTQCDSENCQLRFSCDSIGIYLEKGGNRRSKHLLKRELIFSIELYLLGLLQCVKLLKKGYVLVLLG